MRAGDAPNHPASQASRQAIGNATLARRADTLAAALLRAGMLGQPPCPAMVVAKLALARCCAGCAHPPAEDLLALIDAVNATPPVPG